MPPETTGQEPYEPPAVEDLTAEGEEAATAAGVTMIDSPGAE